MISGVIHLKFPGGILTRWIDDNVICSAYEYELDDPVGQDLVSSPYVF